jgi:GH25 family lysozyme M1 (1,4-beta-N-acetylmuramidase)
VRSSLAAVRRTITRTRRAGVVSMTVAGVLAASALAYGDGIDLSHWQGTVNWTKVDAANKTFAFMKVTEGTSYVDPTYAKNAAAAQSVGIYHGAYHFARPSVGSADAQARYYVAKAGGRTAFQTAGMLPPVLDLEATGGLSVAQLRAWTANWLSAVEDLTGRTPMVYCSPSFWESNLGNSTAFHHYPLWIAHYTTGSPRVPGGWPQWTFWQYTSSGTVSGIAGKVDMNKFSGTSAQLAALALKDGGSSAPVPPGPTLPAGAATTLTMAPDASSTSTINAPVDFEGDLWLAPTTTTGTAASSGPVTARKVTLYAKDAGTTTWRAVASATTDASGHYRLTANVPRTGSYQMRWSGDSSYGPSVSPAFTVTTPTRTAVKVDVHLTVPSVRSGGATMVYGHVTRVGGGGVAGSPVQIYRKPRYSGQWQLIARRTSLAPTGWYSIVTHPKYPRVYKAVVGSTVYYLGATSGTATVRIR